MTRDELVEAAAEALSIVEVIDAVEPLIRADERDVSEALADLRAKARLRVKVAALQDKWQRSVARDPDGKLSGYDRAHVAALGDVLALMDEGGSDA